ncbi:MAG: lantibiotic dehydratase family protein [Bacteroidota bacterium]
MNTIKNPYECFPQFVLRTPLLSFAHYEKLTEGDVVSNDILKEAYSNPLVKESCFLASPTLHYEIEKWISGDLDSKKEKKLRFSLLKYLTRMSSRCTPFGLFAGCSLGSFHDFTSIKNAKPELNRRHTRLDMNYLVALAQDLAKKREIQSQLLHFPNSSIYTSGSQLRYIEYYYVDGRRKHHIVEVDNSHYLQKILKEAKSGAYLIDLISSLESDEISTKEAERFIQDLLDSQLLVSELEPSVSGPEFMNQILEVLKKLKYSKKEITFLERIEKELAIIDRRLGNTPKTYIALSEYLKEYPTSFEHKHLFQTDMELKTIENNLSWDIAKSLKKGVILLNRITPPTAESNLSKFKEAFFERYEEREMPLSRVLDVETGIGYLQNEVSGDTNPLIDDLVLPVQEDPYKKNSIDHNGIYKILEEKLVACDRSGDQKLVLTDNDFKDFPIDWEDLPDTFSAMVQVIHEGEHEKIRILGMGHSSATNLLGRFCHSDNALNTFTQNIANVEEEMNPDKVLAEIVHLPEARVGNIIMRPSFRDYEIPYLAKSDLNLEHQIALEDLFISIRSNNIVLRSKKMNKEIIPHLSNAHNFHDNALPIYQFLCDMQTQNLRENIYFDFGFLGNNRPFLPRVEYKNLILSEAKWKVKKKDIQHLFSISDGTTILKKEVTKWRKSIELPKYTSLNDGENKILVNFMNMTSLQMFLDIVKNREEFLLSEFLFTKDGIVKSDNGAFTHEIITAFYNGKKLQFQKENKNE